MCGFITKNICMFQTCVHIYCRYCKCSRFCCLILFFDSKIIVFLRQLNVNFFLILQNQIRELRNEAGLLVYENISDACNQTGPPRLIRLFIFQYVPA